MFHLFGTHDGRSSIIQVLAIIILAYIVILIVISFIAMGFGLVAGVAALSNSSSPPPPKYTRS